MLLALDTATKKIGIALYDGVEILHESVWQSPFHHTTELSPAILESLQRARVSIDDVKAIGLGTLEGFVIHIMNRDGNPRIGQPAGDRHTDGAVSHHRCFAALPVHLREIGENLGHLFDDDLADHRSLLVFDV